MVEFNIPELDEEFMDLTRCEKYPPVSRRSPDVVSIDRLIEFEDFISDIPW